MKEFIEAYSTYYPYILNILNSKLMNITEAEDICQDLFIEFYKKFNDIQSSSHKSWLFSAMKFTVSNYYRNKGTKKFNAEDIDDFWNNKNLSFENGERDNRIIIQEALDENSGNFEDSEEKVLFDLITIYKYKQGEAAEFLNMSLIAMLTPQFSVC